MTALEPGVRPRVRLQPGIGERIVLDPDRPLRVTRFQSRLTLAVVSIAWLRRQDEQRRTELARRFLRPAEIERAATLRTEKRRLEWLAGRLAVKHGVSTHLHSNRRPADVQVSSIRHGPKSGRPLVNAAVEIALSHSADFAVAACGRHRIGIDLEIDRELPEPMLRMLHADDADGDLRDMPPTLRWACKEAVLKYFGYGLRIDAREVALTEWRADRRFTWTPGPTLRRREPAVESSMPRCWARQVDGYSLALVWK